MAGLSKAHICTQGAAAFYLGGSLLRCSKPKIGENERVGGGLRGKITGFSKNSRRRLLYTMGKILRSMMPYMITLTYPAEFPAEGVVWKNQMRSWWQRLKRRYPKVGGVWKLEPQKRGAPHFHLLVWGLERVPLLALRAFVSRSWYEVVASGDIKHLAAGTRVEGIRSQSGVMRYAGKYMGKLEETEVEGWREPGRFWGVKGAESIPWADLVSYPVSMRQAVKLLRLIRRAMHCRRGNLPGLTMLSNNPDYWEERLVFLIT